MHLPTLTWTHHSTGSRLPETLEDPVFCASFVNPSPLARPDREEAPPELWALEGGRQGEDEENPLVVAYRIPLAVPRLKYLARYVSSHRSFLVRVESTDGEVAAKTEAKDSQDNGTKASGDAPQGESSINVVSGTMRRYLGNLLQFTPTNAY